MARYSKSEIEALKRDLPVEQVIGSFVTLKKNRDHYCCRCPFHEDQRPSLYIYPETNSWYCFGCGAGRKNNGISGDIIGFTMAYRKLHFREAVEKIKFSRPDPEVICSAMKWRPCVSPGREPRSAFCFKSQSARVI